MGATRQVEIPDVTPNHSSQPDPHLLTISQFEVPKDVSAMFQCTGHKGFVLRFSDILDREYEVRTGRYMEMDLNPNLGQQCLGLLEDMSNR